MTPEVMLWPPTCVLTYLNLLPTQVRLHTWKAGCLLAHGLRSIMEGSVSLTCQEAATLAGVCGGIRQLMTWKETERSCIPSKDMPYHELT